ncbi:MAG: hypothetical protein QW279_11365, partial [Candidatus Jordarchaeaceae archaeon]
KPILIPYELYFSRYSANWQNGGVAFLKPNKVLGVNDWTLGRVWKITCEQYEEVRVQEGKDCYNYEIYLGEEDDVPIRIITSENILTPYNKPSDGYIKTITLGLKETYNFSDEEIGKYLITKSGIKENFTHGDLLSVIGSATSSTTA